jgi:hypothetical protein
MREPRLGLTQVHKLFLVVQVVYNKIVKFRREKLLRKSHYRKIE